MKDSEEAFYAWAAGKSYCLNEKKSDLAKAVKEVFDFHRRRYGARRIAAELKVGGFLIGRRLVGSLMKAQGLKAIHPRSFVPKTTESKHGFGYSENLLKNLGTVPQVAGQMIVGDITYVALRGGKFCYLATFQDKLPRRIVGWKVSEKMTAQLVLDALPRAQRRGLIGKGAIIHTDRGSQYASVEYRR